MRQRVAQIRFNGCGHMCSKDKVLPINLIYSPYVIILHATYVYIYIDDLLLYIIYYIYWLFFNSECCKEFIGSLIQCNDVFFFFDEGLQFFLIEEVKK